MKMSEGYPHLEYMDKFIDEAKLKHDVSSEVFIYAFMLACKGLIIRDSRIRQLEEQLKESKSKESNYSWEGNSAHPKDWL